MAKNVWLFILDIRKTVKIYDRAENMICLSGVHGVQIIETGLRPEEVDKEAVLDEKHIQSKAYQVNLEQKVAI